MEFVKFPKIPRLSRQCVVTEKIDGTNGCIYIGEPVWGGDPEFLVGSKNRWITPGDDNYGFARWAYKNQDELLQLGPGLHRGEWWGNGIQRGYGLTNGDKRFSLFNTHKWADDSARPACCGVVPVLAYGTFDTANIAAVISILETLGSAAAHGFMKPEGIVIYHEAMGGYFKKTIEKDEKPKSAR